MVVIAAAIVNRSGKLILSRQFVDISSSRISGLIAAFPKLLSSSFTSSNQSDSHKGLNISQYKNVNPRQYTFIDTDSVRYVYQPIEHFYVIIITTLESNILEDLETLTLLCRIVNEYCPSISEPDLIKRSFEIIFGFDDLISMGYKEKVTLEEIKAAMRMESEEENRKILERDQQEQKAKKNMRAEAMRLNMKRLKGKNVVSAVSGVSSQMSKSSDFSNVRTERYEPSVEKQNPRFKPSGSGMKLGGSGMSLGGKSSSGSNDLMAKLQAEGEITENISSPSSGLVDISKMGQEISQEMIQLNVEENVNISVARDGGIESFDLKGKMTIFIADDKGSSVKLSIGQGANALFKFTSQTLVIHPFIDKQKFFKTGNIQTKPGKSFPVGVPIDILRWKYIYKIEAPNMPLSVNCWPSVISGKSVVNVEYEKEIENLEIENVIISIPIGGAEAEINHIEGDYKFGTGHSTFDWVIPVINDDNSGGSLEFSIPAVSDNSFFPINIGFTSSHSLASIQLNGVENIANPSESLSTSFKSNLNLESYTIS